MKKNYPNFKNPIIAAQTFDFPFVSDPHQGHTMPKGREFIGEKEYLSIEAVISEGKKNKKKCILNIGDSSTSGWDSNIVTLNRERFSKGLPLLPAFFQYKTYSDCLRNQIGSEYHVINAGVPAHTSLQGSRRLKVLLDFFKSQKLSIEWITVYYGNNDSVWDHNRQDKDWVGRKKLFGIDRLVQFLKRNESSIITRVMPEDYQEHMRQIVHTCREHKIKVILIEPITPIYWKPGTRVLNEELEKKNYPGAQKIYPLLDEARELWTHAMKQSSYSDLKQIALEEVREKDYVVPRIKRAHLTQLRTLAESMEIPYVKVDIDRSKNDIRYFIDYCHPIEEANQIISNGISAILSGKGTGKEHLLRKTHESLSAYSEVKIPELPVDHYTLY